MPIVTIDNQRGEVEPGVTGPAQGADFEIQIFDQYGKPRADWMKRGNLVPYLHDSSTFLSTADRTFLINLLGRIRQEAFLRILGE